MTPNSKHAPFLTLEQLICATIQIEINKFILFSTIIKINRSNLAFLYPKISISFGTQTMSDSDEEVADKQFKICLVGDSGSGKTSIANRYASDSFTKNTVETVGVEFCLKRTQLQGNRHITMKVSSVFVTRNKDKLEDRDVYHSIFASAHIGP